MTSSGSPGKPKAKSGKPRGVRFDIPSKPESSAAVSESKIDVRIGGLQVNLEERIHGGPPVTITLSNTRIDYLLTPRENDLDRLLALITPSKGQFDDNEDEIMVDTLLRQRRKGSVLKLTLDDLQAQVTRVQQLDSIPSLGEELARLGTVAKYLPEDDRPGLLTLGLIHNMDASVDVGGRFGKVNAHLTDLELAHIAFPSLAAFGVNTIKVDRNSIEELVGSTIDLKTGLLAQLPVLMVRVIGDEMEPVIKVRMRNINFEYRVPTIMDALGLSSETTPQEFDAMLAASVANLGEQAHTALVGNPPLPSPRSPQGGSTKPTIVNVAFRDCLLGLNPLALTSKLNVVLQDAHVEVALPAADAFGRAEGDYNFDDDFAIAQELGGGDDMSDGEIPDSLAPSEDFGSNSDIEIDENYFGQDPAAPGDAHHWNSAKNRVRDVHVIWNLFDGYDWQHTRDAITKTVEEVETKAHERRSRAGRRSLDEADFDDQDVVGDCLFNSIYVSIPANHDPRELVGGINHQLDDAESIATTSVTTTTTRTATGQFRSRAKKLRLNRSRRHKITFELQGVNVDLVKLPPGSGETDTSIDVRVQNLVVFDHVPTSTWKKFAAYNLDAGERELGASMVHLEILLVKPVPELAAVEFVLKANVLPLRLHVDQDALEFIERFFQFKDESQMPTDPSPSDEAFIQRAEINAIPVTLDFKPKRVDYAGLRGGRTSEFMNFVILERARMTLRHTIVYGTTGWERLGNTLNDIWTPDVKRTQLAGVLAGVAPVRHLVNVGSGFRDLIEIPIKEYKKDGRIVRSIGKGAAAFARTTGTEIVKLGAKVAVGTQYVLQGAEDMLTKPSGEGSSSTGETSSLQTGWEEEDMEPEEKKQISLYADQPTGVVQGLRHAYSSLARDLNVARDAVIAVPGELLERGAARTVMSRAPTIIFRPAIGATRAVGQALMGATNALDPENLRRAEDKYKPGPGR
ncbi:putative atg c terminal domain-containing protein [Diaporthe ampelina]|uniref:Autophagy-related protein 2 n=1 Tax=Diaporthe ampelina TaxID=1214573 RepID=A0A0G2FBS3_9PEZI|nr:putative atg c terminal domain-containing protein [Diaporthe ampelina]